MAGVDQTGSSPSQHQDRPAEKGDATQSKDTANGTKTNTAQTTNGANSKDDKDDETKKHNKLKARVKTLASGPPGGFDDTPLPSAPPGYTLRFTFESAANIPPSDISSGASDPYVLATLKASNPKRHKEDPDLTHRTQTRRNTVDPVWHDQWIVANVPATGFTLKCRIYDEDARDSDDRLGNVTIKIPEISEKWKGIPRPGKEYMAKKRVISKRAYLFKALSSVLHADVHMTPRLTVSIELLEKSPPPHAQMYTLGPVGYVKHFSPMIGRLTGVKVDADTVDQGEEEGETANVDSVNEKTQKKKTKKKSSSQKYDFQANEMQLKGPVPPKLYHRFVEFRPIIGSMFKSSGVRGKILHYALHSQHNRVYNYDSSTEYGTFEAESEAASQQFLRLAHFDSGGRIFTYVLTLDAKLRFTETGKEFGIDLLSKHTMHSDVQRYIACSGEFFIRRLEHPKGRDKVNPDVKTHPSDHIKGGPPKHAPPTDPSFYQLIIDNDSGTYRPDKSVLPELKEFLQKNFPGLGVLAMHWEDEELQKLKQAQQDAKKKEGKVMNLVMNSSESSISSAESDLDDRDGTWEQGRKSKKEAALEALENPGSLKETVNSFLPKSSTGQGESSKA